MNRSIMTIFPALILNTIVVPFALAAELTETTPVLVERHTTIVFDVGIPIQGEQVKGDGKPPSGDGNPSDRHNTTVDTREIINPQG
jgi:hypothetical protein